MFEVTKHDQKYDRQMRLWGGHGQKKLEEAHICCLGSGPTASECLKNLVLPNIGQFTVVDDATVSESDLGNNFFVDEAGLGKPRAEVVMELLVEMNGECKGNFEKKDPCVVIDKEPDFFKKFTLVVACNMGEKPLLKLSALCYENKIPLVILAAYGLLGYARLQLVEHPVVEAHYENDRYDLFVHPEQLKHFPELKAFIDKYGNLDEIKDTLEHAHIPYVVIVSKAIDKWLETHDNNMPKGWDQQKEFKASIKEMAFVYDGDGAEENFHEAVLAAHRAYNKPALEWISQAVLDDPLTTNMNPDAGDFWVVVCAVKRFIREEGKGCLPGSVKIPDMTSTPEAYVELGNIYKTRAERDEGLIHAHAKAILIELGHDENSISLETVTYIVKNLRGIRVIRTGPLTAEYDPKTFRTEDVKEIFEEWREEPNPDEGPNPRIIHWYFAYRAAQKFHLKNGRWPGTRSGDEDEVEKYCEEDTKELIELQTTLFKEYGLEQKIEDVCLREISRFGAAEIHNIAAYIGGVGSQIVLKSLIQQYVPLDNTYIFNGVHGAGQVFKL